MEFEAKIDRDKFRVLSALYSCIPQTENCLDLKSLLFSFSTIVLSKVAFPLSCYQSQTLPFAGLTPTPSPLFLLSIDLV